MAMSTITLRVNGQERTVTTPGERPLLDVLREDLQLTGTKYGCGEGQCGACSVLVDGKRVFSCRTSVSKVDGKIGSDDRRAGHAATTCIPSSRPSSTENAFQCGYCTPGMIMATVALLDENPKPSDDEIVDGMNRNLCRCCSYAKILRRGAARRPKATPEVKTMEPERSIAQSLDAGRARGNASNSTSRSAAAAMFVAGPGRRSSDRRHLVVVGGSRRKPASGAVAAVGGGRGGGTPVNARRARPHRQGRHDHRHDRQGRVRPGLAPSSRRPPPRSCASRRRASGWSWPTPASSPTTAAPPAAARRPRTVPAIRQACAAARELLVGFAAKQWDVDPTKSRSATARPSTAGGQPT